MFFSDWGAGGGLDDPSFMRSMGRPRAPFLLMLTPLVPDQLWTAEMPAQKAGFEFGARMTVVRLPDGDLWVHSPIALTPPLREALDAVAPVRWVVAPSRFHYEHVAEFAAAYPEAQIRGVTGLKDKLNDLRSQCILCDTPEPEWGGVLDQSVFQGSSLYDEADFLHRPTRTLILTDLLFCIPGNRSWTTRLAARMLGVLDHPAPSWTLRLTVRDRAAAKASLERLLEWDFDRVILSHGNIVESGGPKVIRDGFSWLLK